MKKNNLFNEKSVELKFSNEIKHLANIRYFSDIRNKKSLTTDKRNDFLVINVLKDNESNKPFGITLFDLAFEVNNKKFCYILKDGKSFNKIMRGLASVFNGNHYIATTTKNQAHHILNLFFEATGADEFKRNEVIRKWTDGVKGSFSTSKGKFIQEPVISYKISENIEIGIYSVINDCIKFYLLDKKANRIKYTHHCILEKFPVNFDFETENEKIDEELFFEDFEYKKETLNKYKEYSIKAQVEMNLIQDLFKDIFKLYPREFYSSGSLAKAAIAIMLEDLLKLEMKGSKIPLSLPDYYEGWINSGSEIFKINKTLLMAIDAISGSQINNYKQGLIKEGAKADISSSFPSIVQAIPDLRGAKFNFVEKRGMNFEDVPKPSKNKIIILLANITIPEGVVSTINQKIEGEKFGIAYFDNANMNGNQNAVDLYEAFEFLENQKNGIIGEVSAYAEIEITSKEENPFAKITRTLFKVRNNYLNKGEKMKANIVKLILNSIYGLFLEGFAIQKQLFNEEVGEDETVFDGMKAGGYFNPIFGLMVNSFARLRLAEARLQIEKAGGETIQELTDCLIWKGTPDMLPEKFESILKNYKGLEFNGWKTEKSLGYFEKPIALKNILSLSTAFYEYEEAETGKIETKTMGIYTKEKQGRVLLEKLKLTHLISNKKNYDQKIKFLRLDDLQKYKNKLNKILSGEIKGDFDKEESIEFLKGKIKGLEETFKKHIKEINVEDYVLFNEKINELKKGGIFLEDFFDDKKGVYTIPFKTIKPITPNIISNVLLDDEGNAFETSAYDLGRIIEKIEKRAFIEVFPKKEYREINEVSVLDFLTKEINLYNRYVPLGEEEDLDLEEFLDAEGNFNTFGISPIKDGYDSRLFDYSEMVDLNSSLLFVKEEKKSSKKEAKVKVDRKERRKFYSIMLGIKQSSRNKNEETVDSLGFKKCKELLISKGIEVPEGY